MTDLMATVRPTSHTTPVLALAPAPGGTTLITEQQVLFGTAAAVARPRVKTSRWAMAINSVFSAMSALFTDSRPPAQRYQPRRSVYLEDGVMAREVHRL
jgi:hypothetical protein